MFPAVKEGISASRSEKPNNQGSWSLVLACQMIIYLLLVSVASIRELQIKGLFKLIVIPLKYKLLFQNTSIECCKEKESQLQVLGL